MRAIEISTPGGPDTLKLVDRPIPVPGPDEVLIRVTAAGVNRADVIQRKGFYPPPPGASDLPGLEVSGTIEAVGENADFSPGAPVMALMGGGGYAEYALAKAGQLLPVPSSCDLTEAAGLPETVITVWANIYEMGGLTEESALFLHGATSGIGTTAVAMARASGAKIYGTAGSDEKCQIARDLGYEDCFNYRTEDWSARMQELGGADILLDMIGGDYVPKNLALLKPDGTHISIAFQAGPTAQISLPQLMFKRLTLTGSGLRTRSDQDKARLVDNVRRHVLPWIEAGQVKPLIAQTFPLEEASAAHELMESGNLVGKIILTL